MFTVLFVCSGNTCRSPLAENLLRLRAASLPHPVRALSAGTYGLVDAPASMYAVLAGAELGADLSGHLSRPLTAELVRRADLVLVMEHRHHQEVLALAPEAADRTFLIAAFGPGAKADPAEIADPIGGELPAYRATAILLDMQIQRILPEIARRAGAERSSRPAAGPEVPGPGRSG